MNYMYICITCGITVCTFIFSTQQLNSWTVHLSLYKQRRKFRTVLSNGLYNSETNKLILLQIIAMCCNHWQFYNIFCQTHEPKCVWLVDISWNLVKSLYSLSNSCTNMFFFIDFDSILKLYIYALVQYSMSLHAHVQLPFVWIFCCNTTHTFHLYT